MSHIIGWCVGAVTFCVEHAPEGVTENEENVPVLDTDAWAAEVGLCSVCGRFIADDAVGV